MLAYVRAALPPAGARVLEVGAGDGTLAAALRESGYEVRAIDPAGGPGVEAVALAELEAAAEEFDAAVAVLSLHHVEPLAASCARLAEVLRPGARLVVDELDADRVDARAAAWWLARRAAAVGAHPAGEEAHAHAALTPEGVVADLRAHVHPLAGVLEALHPWFARRAGARPVPASLAPAAGPARGRGGAHRHGRAAGDRSAGGGGPARGGAGRGSAVS